MNIKFHGVCYVVGSLLIVVGMAAYYYDVREWIFAAYPWSRIWLIFVGCLLIAVGIIKQCMHANGTMSFLVVATSKNHQNNH